STTGQTRKARKISKKSSADSDFATAIRSKRGSRFRLADSPRPPAIDNRSSAACRGCRVEWFQPDDVQQVHQNRSVKEGLLRIFGQADNSRAFAEHKQFRVMNLIEGPF